MIFRSRRTRPAIPPPAIPPPVASAAHRSEFEFGPIDLVRYAQALCAIGLTIKAGDELLVILRHVRETPSFVIIGAPVDYRNNHFPMESPRPGVFR